MLKIDTPEVRIAQKKKYAIDPTRTDSSARIIKKSIRNLAWNAAVLAE